jgi:RNA polymerase sigma-54 factor
LELRAAVSLSRLGQHQGKRDEACRLPHLSDLAKELTKRLNHAPEGVTLALCLLRTLDPRPGLRFASQPSETIVPDVIVMKVGHDSQVFLNDEGIPRLRISATYRRLLRRGPPEEKRYLGDRLRVAIQFIHRIEQRRQTLYKVATSIVNFQREFFDLGLAQLKPLVLKDVAEDIGMHESTAPMKRRSTISVNRDGVKGMRAAHHASGSVRPGPGLVKCTPRSHLRHTCGNHPAPCHMDEVFPCP